MAYFWTKEEDSVLIAEYKFTKTKILAARLGKTTTSVSSRAHEIGVTKYKPSGKEKILRRKFQKIKASAKERGIEFSLEEALVTAAIASNCHYCGAPPKNMLSNGLDRVISTKGYTPDNVVPCCKVCNFGKNELTPEQYVAHCEQVVAQSKGRVAK